MTRRDGFTTVEMLAVIVVTAILAAILVPAVQSARESSRRAQCRDKLRGLGQALQNFESTRRRFPPSMPGAETKLIDGKPKFGTNKHYAPHVLLLPYLDQQVLYDQFDLTKQIFHTGYIRESLPAPANTTLPVFLCPSDPVPIGNNYRFCTGPRIVFFGGGGAFAGLRGETSGRIQDGFSNTAACSEAVKSDMDPENFTRGDYWRSGFANVKWPADTDEVIPVCDSLSGSPPAEYYYPYVGHTWAVSGYDFTFYNHSLTPNHRIPDCSVDGWQSFTIYWPASLVGVHKASSHHSGGVHVLFLDGSVRFVSDSMDLSLWRGLATIDGNEIVD